MKLATISVTGWTASFMASSKPEAEALAANRMLLRMTSSNPPKRVDVRGEKTISAPFDVRHLAIYWGRAWHGATTKIAVFKSGMVCHQHNQGFWQALFMSCEQAYASSSAFTTTNI